MKFHKTLEQIDRKIAKLRKANKHEKADKLEEFKSNFLLYPLGPEGTVVYRKSVEETERK